MTAVLPVPAPASTSVASSSVAIAAACSSVGGEESTPAVAWTTAGAEAATWRGVSFLPGRLECPWTGERLDAGERPGRALGQVRPRQRAADTQDGSGNVRPERPAPGVAPVTVAGLEALDPLAELREFGGQFSSDAGGVLAQRPGEPLGLVAPEPADSAYGAAGDMNGEPRPEPRAAGVDGVDGEGWDAAGLADVQDAAVERDAGRTATEQADEGGAGRGDGAGRFGHSGPGAQDYEACCAALYGRNTSGRRCGCGPASPFTGYACATM